MTSAVPRTPDPSGSRLGSAL